MNFREMRAKLIGSYGRFVFFPYDEETPKLVSTRAFTHLIIDEDITIYAPRIMEEQLEDELKENYDIVYGEPVLNGKYHVSPTTRAANLTFNWISGEDILRKALRKPFEEEIELLHGVSEKIGAAMDQFWNEMSIGITESETAAKIDALLRLHGIDGFSYPTIVAVGSKSRFPSPSTGTKKIEEGKIVYVDVFPVYHGYPLNFSRVVFTEENNTWINALEKINRTYDSLTHILRPGTELEYIDATIRKIGNFPHYSVVPAGGFYQPFAPGPGVLEENMLLTVVPSIYLKEGVIRVKHTMIIQSSGAEVLF
ncbi:MAG: M24 family metallopeptidase [Euryarchaeota archaeon]|nr:M24 family metallopeptidase [Euryarchaeota archaeon]